MAGTTFRPAPTNTTLRDSTHLANEAASREFSRALWRKVLSHVKPRAWICFGGTPATELQRLLPAAGWRRAGPAERGPVGWANWTYELAR